MPTPVSERVQKRRAALVAEADRTDTDMQDFMDAALADLDDWK